MKIVALLLLMAASGIAGDLKLTNGVTYKSPEIIRTQWNGPTIREAGSSKEVFVSEQDLPECPAKAACRKTASAELAALKRLFETPGLQKPEADTKMGSVGKLTETGMYVGYELAGWDVAINLKSGRCGQITLGIVPKGLDLKQALAALGFELKTEAVLNDFISKGTARDAKGNEWKYQVTKNDDKKTVGLVNLFPP